MVGETDHRWVIKEFKDFVRLGKDIVSPSFSIKTGLQQYQSEVFHLEMVPEKNREGYGDCYRCGVTLVKETRGSVLAKVRLIISPRQRYNTLKVYGDVREAFEISKEMKEEIFHYSVPHSFSNCEEDVTFGLEVSLRRPAKK